MVRSCHFSFLMFSLLYLWNGHDISTYHMGLSEKKWNENISFSFFNAWCTENIQFMVAIITMQVRNSNCQGNLNSPSQFFFWNYSVLHSYRSPFSRSSCFVPNFCLHIIWIKYHILLWAISFYHLIAKLITDRGCLHFSQTKSKITTWLGKAFDIQVLLLRPRQGSICLI